MMEKSGCLQLTQEQLDALKHIRSETGTQMNKAAQTLDTLGLSYDEVCKVLDSGEYRIVEG